MVRVAEVAGAVLRVAWVVTEVEGVGQAKEIWEEVALVEAGSEAGVWVAGVQEAVEWAAAAMAVAMRAVAEWVVEGWVAVAWVVAAWAAVAMVVVATEAAVMVEVAMAAARARGRAIHTVRETEVRYHQALRAARCLQLRRS